jgi:hypothetical protein
MDIQNPFVTKWHTLWIDRIPTRPTSMICLCVYLRLSGLSGFLLSVLCIDLHVNVMMGGTVDSQRSYWVKLWPAKTMLKQFYA